MSRASRPLPYLRASTSNIPPIVTLENTDGASSKLPEQSEPYTFDDGTVDCLIVASDKSLKYWKRKIGTLLVHQLKNHTHRKYIFLSWSVLPMRANLHRRLSA